MGVGLRRGWPFSVSKEEGAGIKRCVPRWVAKMLGSPVGTADEKPPFRASCAKKKDKHVIVETSQNVLSRNQSPLAQMRQT